MKWRKLKQLIRSCFPKKKEVYPVEEQVMLTKPVTYKNIYMTQSGFYREPAKRSVIFLNNSYYHFYYLAQALRRRDWDVLLACTENPNYNSYLYYHGEDINLYSPYYEEYMENIQNFFTMAKDRYKLLHVANDGVLSFYPKYYPEENPPDIIEWKAVGNKIAYTVSGCNSGISQTALRNWSQLDLKTPVCDVCPHQQHDMICSDEKNLNWGKKFHQFCDVIFGEGLPALDFINGAQVIREPTTMCLDPMLWHPDLEIPSEHIVRRNKDEVLIYHAVGNYHSRTTNGKNLKGTHIVLETIERLQQEGFNVRLVFETGKRNKELRFLQAQADVVIDQLNIGRYGATSRETMMLGKPTICFLNKHELDPKLKLKSLAEVPLISANEETLYQELKKLILDKEARIEIGKKAREYALKWHSADACAERYEIIYDQMMTGNSFSYPTKWNYFLTEKKSVSI